MCWTKGSRNVSPHREVGIGQRNAVIRKREPQGERWRFRNADGANCGERLEGFIRSAGLWGNSGVSVVHCMRAGAPRNRQVMKFPESEGPSNSYFEGPSPIYTGVGGLVQGSPRQWAGIDGMSPGDTP